MKVILIKDVAGLGGIGQIKDIKPGYGRNYLLRKGFAVLPSDPKAQEIMIFKKENQNLEKQKSQQKIQQIDKIAGKNLVFIIKADSGGNLYGSIGKKEIAKKIGLDEDEIKFDNSSRISFKKVGTYPLTLDFGKEKVSIKIVIKKES